MINDLMDKVIAERKKKHMNDGDGICACWDKMADILSMDVCDTISYLESCPEEDLYFVSEIFEDVSLRLKSKEYIECLRRLDKKFPQLDMTKDIDLAEKYMNVD